MGKRGKVYATNMVASRRLAVGAVKAFQEFLAGRDHRKNARKSARVTSCTCAGGLCRRIHPELSQSTLPAGCSYHVWKKIMQQIADPAYLPKN